MSIKYVSLQILSSQWALPSKNQGYMKRILLFFFFFNQNLSDDQLKFPNPTIIMIGTNFPTGNHSPFEIYDRPRNTRSRPKSELRTQLFYIIPIMSINPRTLPFSLLSASALKNPKPLETLTAFSRAWQFSNGVLG